MKTLTLTADHARRQGAPSPQLMHFRRLSGVDADHSDVICYVNIRSSGLAIRNTGQDDGLLGGAGGREGSVLGPTTTCCP